MMPAETGDMGTLHEVLVDFKENPETHDLDKKCIAYPTTNCNTPPLNVSLNQDSSESYQTPFSCKTKLSLTSNETSTCSMDLICQSNPYIFPKSIYFNSSFFGGQYTKKSLKELELYSPNDLKALRNDLSKTVEEISNQLVQLLLENDALQQESDARNIAIEQLLKITVKVNESELKPVQMSVILSHEECGDSV